MATRARPLVTASRVKGTLVYNAAGDCIGHVHDLSIDKATGQVLYALVSFSNFLNLGRHRFHTIAWEAIHYDTAMEGYICRLDRADLHQRRLLTQLNKLSFDSRDHICH